MFCCILGSSERVEYSNNQFIIGFLKRLSGFNIQIMKYASLGLTVKELDSNKVEVIKKNKSEEDVPGAILTPKIPEECTVKDRETAAAMALSPWS